MTPQTPSPSSSPSRAQRLPRSLPIVGVLVVAVALAFALAGSYGAAYGAPDQQSLPTPTITPTPALAQTGPVSQCLALRTYGRESYGAGDSNVTTRTLTPACGATTAGSGVVEDRPYTDPEGPFDPQNAQAPRYDSLTWNPAILSEVVTPDENQRAGLYRQLFFGGINAAEKVWARQWYEPDHLDKNQDGSTLFPFLTPDDIHYPAIMQEYTYSLLGNQPLDQEPRPAYGRVGSTTLVFPIGQRKSELLTSSGALQTSGTATTRGLGLTSLDADFDNVPDIVHVESEQSLFNALSRNVTVDFNQNCTLDPLDRDGVPLSGDELAIFRLDPKTLDLDPNSPNGTVIQFLDHVAVLRNMNTNPNGAQFDIYWTGSLAPRYLGAVVLGQGDIALANINGAPTVIRSGDGNLGTQTSAPWFLYVESSDAIDG